MLLDTLCRCAKRDAARQLKLGQRLMGHLVAVYMRGGHIPTDPRSRRGAMADIEVATSACNVIGNLLGRSSGQSPANVQAAMRAHVLAAIISNLRAWFARFDGKEAACPAWARSGSDGYRSATYSYTGKNLAFCDGAPGTDTPFGMPLLSTLQMTQALLKGLCIHRRTAFATPVEGRLVAFWDTALLDARKPAFCADKQIKTCVFRDLARKRAELKAAPYAQILDKAKRIEAFLMRAIGLGLTDGKGCRFRGGAPIVRDRMASSASFAAPYALSQLLHLYSGL